jgi:hypothetical protein
MFGLRLGRLGRAFPASPIAPYTTILRPFGTQSNLRISSLTSSTATSTGPVTIADGGGVEVLPNKTWRIT